MMLEGLHAILKNQMCARWNSQQSYSCSTGKKKVKQAVDWFFEKPTPLHGGQRNTFLKKTDLGAVHR